MPTFYIFYFKEMKNDYILSLFIGEYMKKVLYHPFAHQFESAEIKKEQLS